MREQDVRQALAAAADEFDRRRTRAACLGLPTALVGAGILAQACAAYGACAAHNDLYVEACGIWIDATVEVSGGCEQPHHSRADDRCRTHLARVAGDAGEICLVTATRPDGAVEQREALVKRGYNCDTPYVGNIVKIP